MTTLVKTWPTFPGDNALRSRTTARTPKARLQGSKKYVRRSKRHGEWGRMMEERVSGILERMENRGLISGFTYHRPNSPEDGEGKDFTVWREREGARFERSFGITITPPNRFSRVVGADGESPQWYLPINTKDETITRKVKDLL